MRRLFIYLLLSLPITAFAQKFTLKPTEGGEMSFRISSKSNMEVELVSVENQKVAKLKIPSTVNYKSRSYTVVSIGKSAFENCDEFLTDLSFPETIRSIDSYIFLSTKVSMGAAFSGNFMKRAKFAEKGLNSFLIGKTTKDIAPNAFVVTLDLRHPTNVTLLKANIEELPSFITPNNCTTYGISLSSVEAYYQTNNQIKNQYAAVLPAADNNTKVEDAQLPALTMTSDVDINIPHNSVSNSNTFAVIIANEDYQKESNVEFARNDGRMFAQYCQQVLGLPEKNIHLAENATLNNIIFELDWLKNVCEAFAGDACVIVYYAGHGIPDESNGTSYLLPIDGRGQNVRTCFRLDEFYKILGEMPTKNLTVFMDACFSGARRNGDMLTSARGVAIKSKPAKLAGNMVVLTAAQGDETAYGYKEKNHGLFTYFLLKKLQETNGKANLGELSDYICKQVSRVSIVENGKRQTPTVITSGNGGNEWKKINLKL